MSEPPHTGLSPPRSRARCLGCAPSAGRLVGLRRDCARATESKLDARNAAADLFRALLPCRPSCARPCAATCTLTRRRPTFPYLARFQYAPARPPSVQCVDSARRGARHCQPAPLFVRASLFAFSVQSSSASSGCARCTPYRRDDDFAARSFRSRSFLVWRTLGARAAAWAFAGRQGLCSSRGETCVGCASVHGGLVASPV